MSNPRRSAVAAALIAAGLAVSAASHAVRINPDGHGQALIYPYYTARSSEPGHSFVTALTVINTSKNAKALKVRFVEGKGGAEVQDFNLFLSAYDVWTAGVIASPSAQGAALFTLDNSCTTPRISNSSANPNAFRNGAYSGIDAFGDSLDRTYEGYLEILEMGTIASGSGLEAAVTQRADLSSPNASKPSCANLPVSAAVPPGLSAPTGGLIGNISIINVNDGTDFGLDAIALSQWSDRVQWTPAGSVGPTLADASPASSVVLDSRDEDDLMVVTRWTTGRDAVSALFMTYGISNDFTVEQPIKAATDWIISMPTKRFYVRGNQTSAPFSNVPQPSQLPGPTNLPGEGASRVYFDRESLSSDLVECLPLFSYCRLEHLRYTVTTLPWVANEGFVRSGTVLGGENLGSAASTSTKPAWINGRGTLTFDVDGQKLVAPPGQSAIVNTQTGAAMIDVDVTYFGIPAVGFAAQAYRTSGLPGINPNVLSNYGGSFNHRYRRRIEVTQ